MADCKWLKSLASCAAVRRNWSTVALRILWSRHAALINLFQICGLNKSGGYRRFAKYPSKELLDRFLFYRDFVRHASWDGECPDYLALMELVLVIPGGSPILPSLTRLELQSTYYDDNLSPLPPLVFTHPGLQILHISNIRGDCFPLVLWQMLSPRVPNLLELHLEVDGVPLSYCPASTVSAGTKEGVAYLLAKLKKLKRLRLSFAFQSQDVLQAVASMAHLETISWTRDKVSDISSNPNFDSQGLAALDGRSNCFSALTCVKFNLPFRTSLAFLDFLQKQQSAAVVTAISLETKETACLEEQMLPALSKLVSQGFPSLSSLSIITFGTNTDHRVTISELQKLENCAKLEDLHIEIRSACSLWDASLVRLLGSWPKLLKLALIFPKSDITSNILTVIAQIQPKLQTLFLSCSFSNDNLSYIHRFSCLRELALDFPRLGQADPRAISLLLAMVLTAGCKIKPLLIEDGRTCAADTHGDKQIMEPVKFAWEVQKAEAARKRQLATGIMQA